MAGSARADSLSPAERRGREIFQRGTSSSGRPVSVSLNDEPTPVTFACAGCHARDGRGRSEGGIRPPDVRWETLSRPRLASGESLARPAYDRARLRRAVTMGIDPAGRRLDPVMPRYHLFREDADDLLAFLGRLGMLSEPGLTEGAFRVAVFLPAGPQRGAARRAIDAWAGDLATRGGIYTRRPEVVYVEGVAGLEQLGEEDEPFVIVGRPGDASTDVVEAWVEAHEVPWMRAGIADDAVATNAWIATLPAPRAGEPPPWLREVRALAGALEKIGRAATRERLLKALE